MKTSGTKPMKNTMRKKSPLKFKVTVKTASGETKSLKELSAAKRANSTPTTKPGGPSASAKTPAMQMKKSGMGKKC